MISINHDVFGQIMYDYLWEGKKEVEFYKKRKDVIIAINGDEDAVFEKSQIESYIEFFKNEKKYLSEAEREIFNYYQKIYLEYRDMMGESADECLPLILNQIEMGNLVDLTQITFPYSFGKDERVVGLLLNCSWEEEHGLGVKFVNERVVKVGFQDIIL